MGEKTDQSEGLRLKWYEALWDALINKKDNEFFPVQSDGGRMSTRASESILKDIYDALKELNSAPEGATTSAAGEPGTSDGQGKASAQKAKSAIEAVVERGRETLDEGKKLTEYTDQKSSRLLTVATLFVALAGLLLNNFVPGHPVRFIPGGDFDPRQIGRGLVYISFGLFVLSVVAGALVTFYANQTRFRYRPLTSMSDDSAPRSRLFFIGIVRTDPKAWAESFIASTKDGAKGDTLSVDYAKNYIAESYLIAAKIADKMRYLSAAQSILGFSLRVLLFWFILIAVVSVLDPGERPSTSTSSPPTEVIIRITNDVPGVTVHLGHVGDG